ncbi:hypothetical protein [Erythrobacter crassostreae]|uniref:Uncharacterized protein n=1 Tax=Erythrobacter crassostreae TaxID=2828328 RepID=A0A9X1F7I7_9SPHN|nr:hypothetical protein [Erythrobacter crassostrea]MBV7260210.1 hypothetical protein [Erythrobacter crassostrea]
MTYIKNVLASVFIGVVAYFMVVIALIALGFADVSIAKPIAIIFTLAVAVAFVISQKAEGQTNG